MSAQTKADRQIAPIAPDLPIVADRAWCDRCDIHVPWSPDTGSAGGHGHIGADECCTGCPGPYVALRTDRTQAAPRTTGGDA